MKLKAIKYTIVALIIFGINFKIHSQNKTIKTLEKANNTVVQTKGLIDSIFNKKEKSSSGNHESISSNNPSPIKVKVVSNPIVLDADNLFPFYDGAAIIQKGQSTALINSKGEFIVPYNQYLFDTRRSKNGFFLVNQPDGFVNSSGQYFETKSSSGEIQGEYLVLPETPSQTGNYIYEVTGKKYLISEYNYTNKRIGNKLIPFGAFGKMGYKDLNNKLVIETEYEVAYPFYDGVAVIGKKNQYGELYYGYIDTTGKPITDIQFSRIPQPFSDGFGLVYYRELPKYSIIDKKGEVVFTEQDRPQFGPFNYGYSLKKGSGSKNPMVLDKSMNQISVQQFLNNYGVFPKNNSGILIMPSYNSPGVFMETYSSPLVPFSYYDGQSLQFGYIFLEKSSVIVGKFVRHTDENIDSHHDTVSDLKLVEVQNSNSVDDITQGYMNSNGEITIIKGKASNW